MKAGAAVGGCARRVLPDVCSVAAFLFCPIAGIEATGLKLPLFPVYLTKSQIFSDVSAYPAAFEPGENKLNRRQKPCKYSINQYNYAEIAKVTDKKGLAGWQRKSDWI